jgi:hypothetical protein
MTIPIALTLVAVSVAAIASIMVAVLKFEVDSLKLKNDRLHDDLHLEKKRVKECESGFNSISDALAKSEFEIVKLKDQLSTADKAYDLLVKELEATKRKRGANGRYLKSH